MEEYKLCIFTSILTFLRHKVNQNRELFVQIGVLNNYNS